MIMMMNDDDCSVFSRVSLATRDKAFLENCHCHGHPHERMQQDDDDHHHEDDDDDDDDDDDGDDDYEREDNEDENILKFLSVQKSIQISCQIQKQLSPFPPVFTKKRQTGKIFVIIFVLICRSLRLSRWMAGPR